MSLNRILLVGRLTRDAEGKFTPAGKYVCNFNIAVDRGMKDKDGNKQTDFFNITAWEKTATFVTTYLSKGRLVSIDGRLQNRSWIDQATGQKRTVSEIVAEHVNGLDKKPGDDNGDNEAPHPAETGVAASPASAVAAADELDDPFSEE